MCVPGQGANALCVGLLVGSLELESVGVVDVHSACECSYG